MSDDLQSEGFEKWFYNLVGKCKTAATRIVLYNCKKELKAQWMLARPINENYKKVKNERKTRPTKQRDQ